MMPEPYQTLHLFENNKTLIVEVRRLDLPKQSEPSLVNHWLFYDRASASLVKLWLNSTDSSSAIEERYFEQGYLKFNKAEGTYIEKYNSAQHKLNNNTDRVLSMEIKELIAGYFYRPDFSNI